MNLLRDGCDDDALRCIVLTDVTWHGWGAAAGHDLSSSIVHRGGGGGGRRSSSPDEPTSGLDSKNQEAIVELLQELAAGKSLLRAASVASPPAC